MTVRPEHDADRSTDGSASASNTGSRPEQATLSPQEPINLQWAARLARRYPGTRWEIVRENGEDGEDGDDGHGTAV